MRDTRSGWQSRTRRVLATCLALLFLGGIAWSAPQESLLEAAQAIRTGAQGLVDQSAAAAPEPTWGQAQAREDLVALAAAAGEIAAAMGSGDPTVTPQSLKPATSRLDVARRRVKASLPLLGLPDAETAGAPLLERAARLSEALRQLDNRFLGLAQVGGSHLGDVALGEAGQPLVYDNPNALLREARGIRTSAEQMLASVSRNRGDCRPGGIPVGFGASPVDERNLRELVHAAYEFEWSVGSGYPDVQATRESYLRLRRAYQRATPYWSGPFGDFAAHDLERALQRLDAFYEKAGGQE